jgi:hypothetical protein
VSVETDTLPVAPDIRHPRELTPGELRTALEYHRQRAYRHADATHGPVDPEKEARHHAARARRHAERVGLLRAELRRRWRNRDAPLAALTEARKGKPRRAGRKIGRKHSEVRALGPGSEIRFNDAHHRDVWATIVNHSRNRKGEHRSLVHVHATGQLMQVSHRQVTHVRKPRSKHEARGRLMLARTVAGGHRGETADLEPNAYDRRVAASHLRHVEDALRATGWQPHPSGSELDLSGGERPPWRPKTGREARGEHGSREYEKVEGEKPGEQMSMIPAHERLIHLEDVKGAPPFDAFESSSRYKLGRSRSGEDYAHPRKLHAGDEIRFYRDDAARTQPTRAEMAVRGFTGSTGTGRRGVVLENQPAQDRVRVFDLDRHREYSAPYHHIHHMKLMPVADRQESARRIQGKAGKDLRATIASDRKRREIITHEGGLPAFVRTGTYKQGRPVREKGRIVKRKGGEGSDVVMVPQHERQHLGYPHGSSIYPSAPEDQRGSAEHEFGGVEPFYEFTDSNGELRD